MKGTIHNIHPIDGIWMFKYVLVENKRSSIHRIPFVFKEGLFEDEQELEVIIESVQGIDVARPK